jgi:hypothetical protein
MTRLAIASCGIWLGATFALRLWGQYVLDPSAAWVIPALLIGSAPVMFYLPRGLFRLSGIDRGSVGRGVVALVAPGMLLDAAVSIWFPVVYPNIRPDAAGLFGGWLLFCNALALIGAATLRQR